MGHDPNRYPGYKFRRSSDDDCLYVSDDERRQIIEVFGPPYIIETPQGRRWNREMVAILRDDDAPLYEMLQWKNYWRWHTAVAMGGAMRAMMIWIVLLICHIGAYRLGVFGDNTLIILLAIVLLPILEVIIGFRLWSFARTCYGITTVLIKVRSNMQKKFTTRMYYRDLFTQLSNANARDKAEAAKTMLLFF